ncbi:MAG: NnrS family protein [Proteobacteria bacterium]|nr:NnrS family protein [Pseudomonadota bacterium]
MDLEGHIKRLFSLGFRPLFTCTCLSGLLLVVWWMGALRGLLPVPGGGADPIAWHAHEMLFGFVGSAIGGFLLTAVANWTGRPPVSGWWLFLLVLFWLGARVVVGVDLGLAPVAILVVDVSFWLLLTTLMGREVVLGKNLRNLKVVLILGLVTLLNVLFHFYPALAIRGATMLVCVLISVIGGRIIPAFTGNWLRAHRPGQGTPQMFNRFDTLVVSMTVLLAICWALMPDHTVTGVVAVLAGLLQLARLMRWQGHLTVAEPLLLVLHVGYSWLGIGFVLLGGSILTGAYPVSGAVHALTVGAMAGLILAVSSRAALGHTGRPLTAGVSLSVAFVLVHLAAIARVLTPVHADLLLVSALLWTAALLVFTIAIGPVLLGRPRQG